MIQPPSVIVTLVERLLLHEAGDSRNPEALATAVVTILERLREELEADHIAKPDIKPL